MMTDSDIARMDAIMAKTMQRREDRGFMIPDRDEERIAEILSNAERRAVEEHALLMESTQQFASAVKFQEAANDSEDAKDYSQLDYLNFDFE